MSARRCGMLLALALAAPALAGCGMRHFARTLGKGNAEVRANIGGPFIGGTGKVSVAAPLPILRIGGRYGVTDWLDLDASLDPGPLALGLAVFNVGNVVQIYREPHGLAVSMSARLQVVSDLDDGLTTRAFPEVAAHVEHMVDEHWTLFGGLISMYQLDPPRGKPPGFLTPYMGVEYLFPPTKRRGVHGLALQLGWISPWEDATSIVEWQPGAGAITVHAGWRVSYGRPR